MIINIYQGKNMKKRLLILGTALCLGALLSIVNYKKVYSIVDANIEALTYSWDGQHVQYWFEYANGQILEGCSGGSCGWVGRCKKGSFSGGLMAMCKISKNSVDMYRYSTNYVVYNWCCDSCPSTTYCGIDD